MPLLTLEDTGAKGRCGQRAMQPGYFPESRDKFFVRQISSPAYGDYSGSPISVCFQIPKWKIKIKLNI